MILFGMAWIPLVASLVVTALTQVFTRAQREQQDDRAAAHRAAASTSCSVSSGER